MVLLNEKSVTPRLNNTVNDSNEDSNIWYLDNGASNHMTGLRGKFKELDEGVNGQVMFGDGSTIKIQGSGSVQCTTSDDKEVCEQTRRLFPSATDFTAKERLELIHGDICGPISPPTPVGNSGLTMRFTEGGLNVNLKTFSSFEQFLRLSV
ncbi:hypothetical protein AgCh_014421 [Apium graveolens]